MTGKLKKVFNDFNFPGESKFAQILKKLGVKASTKEIKDFLHTQTINQTFNEPKKKQGHSVSFQYLDVVQMDIIDMSTFYNTNSHYKYVLLIIDTFSRFVWAYAMKSKTIESVEEALDKFFSKNKPNIIVSDNEASFMSGVIQKLFHRLDIKHITADPGDHKVLGVIDRLCRTIKVIIYKYMKQNNTTKYIDRLGDIIDSYNNSPHSSLLQLTPKEATLPENEEIIFNLNLEKAAKNNRYSNLFKVGDTIRVRNRKQQFERAFDEKYSDVKTIQEIGKKRAILTDGSSVDLRRLRKIQGLVQEKGEKDEVENAKKENKIKKKLAKEQLDIKEEPIQEPARVLRSNKTQREALAVKQEEGRTLRDRKPVSYKT
jgi:hypothetical protein